MTDIRDLLERGAEAIEPSPDALSRVLSALRRRQRQRVVAIVASVGLIAGGLAGIGVLARREPRPSVAERLAIDFALRCTYSRCASAPALPAL